jgi:transposase
MAIRLRVLTEKERAAIERLAQSRTVAARLVERARIIRAAAEGKRVRIIAAELQVHPETVRLWIKRMNAQGLDGLRDEERSGRPATYTPEVVGEVIATALTKPTTLGLPFGSWTLDRLEVDLNEEKGIPIKRTRIDELLIAEGLRWRSQETWFGERAALERTPAETGKAAKKERPVDPAFAEKRDGLPGSIRSLRRGA